MNKLYIVIGVIGIALIGIFLIKKKKENLTFFNPVNYRYWPSYYYSYPYNTNTGAWPPGMYSKLYYWEPGFQTSGWSTWLRPGMYYKRWPRSRWIRNNGNKYFINNGGSNQSERENDYYSSDA